MDTQTTLYELQAASKKIENAFLSLSSLFPQLMTVQQNSSSKQLREELKLLSEDNNELVDIEESFFIGRETMYGPLLERLNQEIQTLTEINVQIDDIRRCSEDMELIALNAMVISIKSGEKGRAFSSITENLKRLSSEMITSSGRLIDEEDVLLKTIGALKHIFTAVSDAQKKMSELRLAGSAELKSVMEAVEQPLLDIDSKAGLVWMPIAKAMESVQMQDIIRQSLDQITLCLSELKGFSASDPVESRLDRTLFDIELYQLAVEILKDVHSKLEESNALFSSNWGYVSDTLNSVETSRLNYIDAFLHGSGPDEEGLPDRINGIVAQFRKMVEEFSSYMVSQKDLIRICRSITDKGRSMYFVFGDLRPVISRLHHVRVLQQIEVSKNDAISAVKDSANDMDALIQRSNVCLDTMQALIENFLAETDALLSSFSHELVNAGTAMSSIKLRRSDFFIKLQNSKNKIFDILHHFSVYPDGFEEKCREVEKLLGSLIETDSAFCALIGKMSDEIESLQQVHNGLLSEAGLTRWEVQDNNFKALINRFTITSHKEAAGSIAGINVESGMDSGEITFF